MLTLTDMYLICLIEELTEMSKECAEAAQRASKALRFGLDEIQYGQELSNRERLQEEVNDVLCAISHLAKMGVIEADDLTPRFSKGKKFYQMLELSRQLGRLEPEPMTVGKLLGLLEEESKAPNEKPPDQ